MMHDASDYKVKIKKGPNHLNMKSGVATTVTLPFVGTFLD